LIEAPTSNHSIAIDFADDGHYEADINEPRSIDFGPRSIGEHETSKKDRKAKKRSKKRMAHKEDKADALITDASIPLSSLPSHPSAPVTDINSPQPADVAALPKRKSPFRPTIPSLLSNTVFSTAAVSNNPTQSTPGHPGLRRTRSLPSRMNRPPPVGNAVQFARGAARIPTTVDVTANDTPPERKESEISRTAAVVMLLVSTALVAVCAEFLVDAIPEMIESSSVSEAFIGLIILPIVGNAAEHVTAVSVATKNKMDLAIGVSVGSSIQIGESTICCTISDF
jgi:Ca2+:H+ antiporter